MNSLTKLNNNHTITKLFKCNFSKNFMSWMRFAFLWCFLVCAMTRFPVVSLLTLSNSARTGSTSTKGICSSTSTRTGRRRKVQTSCIVADASNRLMNGLSSSSGKNDIHTSIKEVEEQIQSVEQKFYELNNHTNINLCSPRQVAKAIQCPNVTQSYLQSIIVAPQHQYTTIQRQMADTMILWKKLNKRKIQLLLGDRRNISHQGTISANYTTFTDNNLSRKDDSSILQEDGAMQEIASSNFSPILPTKKNSHSNYQDFIESLFSSEKCQIHQMWKNVLLQQVDKPSANNLVFQLKSDVCPMGYHYFNSNNKPPKSSASSLSTPLLDFVRRQKQKYPTSIILTRVGEFYEAIGLDAILLIQFCGLNPMGGKPKAGCPIQNIQQTLDGLTQHGFSIAVYEEATNASKNSQNKGSSIAKKGNDSNNKLKRRIFAQQVTPANPTYMYDLCLGVDALDVLSSQVEARPHVGIVHSASAGYAMVEILWEERLVRVSERLPAEAVSCRLSAYPPVEPLFYVPTLTDLERKKSSAATSTSSLLPFLPSPDRTISSGTIYASSSAINNNIRVQWLPPFLLSEEVQDVSEVERYKNVFVNELLRTFRSIPGNNEDEQTSESVSAADFTLSLTSSTPSSSDSITTMPLHKETAIQLGLLGNPVIPNLVSYLLTPNSPAATRRFLKRWLLIPPPSHIATSMRRLIHYLMVEHNHPQPPMYVPQVGKVVSLIRAYQASSPVFRELIGILSTTLSILNTYNAVDDVLSLIEHESGMKAEKYFLLSRCSLALQCIEQVVQPLHINQNTDKCSDFGSLVPKAFFERNEADWRGRIRRDVAEQTYVNVERTAKTLVDTIQRDFWGNPNDADINLRNTASSSSLIAHDIFNNMLSLKSVPRWATIMNNSKENYYYHPRDRNGKLLKDRWTTKDVDYALSSYLQACQDACNDVRSTLTQLSETLCHAGHLPTIVQATHANLIISTAYYHASQMSKKKWNLAHVTEADESDSEGCVLKFFNLWPYWMDVASAVPNSFEVRGLYILTSPNMAGKSTLMRSTAAAALLTACGLCAPLGKGSWIKPFDTLFVRGASADVPSEGKSAFGAEMGDIATLLRCCGEHSLVFVDELARGTSPRDGTSLAGAILEKMALQGMSGFFATHLHGILSLPIQKEAAVRLGRRRMALNETRLGDRALSYGWSYKIEEGVCTESLALNTAERFGLSQDILKRAETFLELVSDLEIVCSSSGNQGETNISRTAGLNKNAGEVKETCEGLPAISRYLEDVVADAKVFNIPSQHLPPAQLARSPCVYVLQLEDGIDHRYYVGQTANLSNRIRQHRQKGSHWKASDAIAISVEKGTDEARIIESRTIRELSRLGFKLISWADGV